jgi:hypothetical protein
MRGLIRKKEEERMRGFGRLPAVVVSCSMWISAPFFSPFRQFLHLIKKIVSAGLTGLWSSVLILGSVSS